jgi:hypothetical protein
MEATMTGITHLALVQFSLVVLFLLPAVVLIGIDYLIYQSMDRRILLLAFSLALVVLLCFGLDMLV